MNQFRIICIYKVYSTIFKVQVLVEVHRISSGTHLGYTLSFLLFYVNNPIRADTKNSERLRSSAHGSTICICDYFGNIRFYSASVLPLLVIKGCSTAITSKHRIANVFHVTYRVKGHALQLSANLSFNHVPKRLNRSSFKR